MNPAFLRGRSVRPIPGLRCLTCRSDELHFGQEEIDCLTCGATYALLSHVPVMFDSVTVSRSCMPGRGTALEVLNAFDLPTDAVTVQRIRHLFAREARYGNRLIYTESNQFLDRVRSTGYLHHGAAAGEIETQAPAPAGSQPRYCWPMDYVPRRLPASAELFANVRIENVGDCVLHRAGERRVTVGQRWHTRDGVAVEVADTRTPLPIDMHPGQAITFPVNLATPKLTGRYILTLVLVQEGVRWLDADARSIPVRVSEATQPDVPEGWTVRPGNQASYGADHARGLEVLRCWLREHARGRPRILELGGNARPMIAGLDGELYNVDVDLRGLQVGKMVAERARTSVHFVCADAENLPFGGGFFDVIVVFSSLHHLPDPARCLTHLRDKLRPGGFIAVMCEPVGHIWPEAIDPAFLAELKKGVNEQSFTLMEYDRIFRQAELNVAEAVIDASSLKSRLTRYDA